MNKKVSKLIPSEKRNDCLATYVKAFCFIGIYFLVLFGIVTAESTWVRLALFATMGVTIAGIGFNLFHDSVHGSISKKRSINKFFAYLSCSLIGASRYLWLYKHNILHHQYPNIQNWDDDLETRKNLRLTPYQKGGARYRYQYLYCLFIYSLTTIEWVYVKDFIQYFTLRMNENQPIPRLTRKQKIEFWTAKLVYFSLLVALPLCFVSFGVWLIGTIVMHLVTSVTLASIFQLAHINPKCEISKIDPKTGMLDVSWAEHQLRTTMDFAVKNRVLTSFAGGLNLQVPHHLFPGISHHHYSKIQKVVAETAKEFGIDYHVSPTYFGALRAHLKSLKDLGRGQSPDSVPVTPKKAQFLAN